MLPYIYWLLALEGFLVIIAGTNSIGTIAQGFAWGLIGIIMSLRWEAADRDPLKSGSPVEFSWQYLLKDNKGRIPWSIILVFVGMRFGHLVIGIKDPVAAGFLMGLFGDKLISEKFKHLLRKKK